MGRQPGTAFDNFVNGQATALLRSAYLLTGDRDAAEDLLQDTLEQVYACWSQIAGSPEAYARRGLVNAATNRWRRRRRRPEARLPVDPDHAGAVEVHAVVLDALRDLPTRQRVVVVLRYFDDLSEADVASLLGCSIGRVTSHASRGLARLRAAVGPPASPPGRNP